MVDTVLVIVTSEFLKCTAVSCLATQGNLQKLAHKTSSATHYFVTLWNTHSLCFQVSIPVDPVELSFWVAMNLPIDDAQRLRVLQMDCAVPRLRMELSLLKKVSKMQSYIF